MLLSKNTLNRKFQKITIFSILFILLILSIFVFFLIPHVETFLINEKKQALQEKAIFVTKILQHLDGEVQKGSIQEDEAQIDAIALIKDFYNNGEENYFWITRLDDGTIIMHPFENLNGQNIEDLEDIQNYNFGKDMLEMANRKGGGFITYKWPMTMNSEEVSTKISYVSKFEPWGWMLGTGMYLDNVQKEIHDTQQRILAIFGCVFFLMIGFLIYVIKAGTKIEKQKELTEQRYMSLVKHLPIAVVRLEILPNGTSSPPLVWNQALVDLLELPDDKPFKEKKLHIHDFLIDAKTRKKLVTKTLKDGLVVGEKINFKTFKGNQIWVKVFITLVKENGSRFFDVSMEDVTKEEKIKELLKQSNIELQKVNDMKSEIIAITSHELRTPLTLIKGLSSSLLNDKNNHLNQHQKDYLNKISRNVDELLKMIRNMLDLEKLKTGKIQFDVEEVNVNDVLKEVYEDFEQRCQQEHKEITLDLPKSPLTTIIDHDCLKHMLMNIIDNAIKFTEPNEGKIHIFTKKPTSDKIEIHVKDNGIGIPDSNLDEIFKEFRKTNYKMRHPKEGTGLGLSIVKNMIEQFDGTINVKSTEGQGSDFYITLPLKK